MSKAAIDRRKCARAVALVVFSFLFLPMLAVSPRGFDFAAMAQEEALSLPPPSSSSSDQTETAAVVVAQTPEEKANLDRFNKLDFEAWNNRNWTLFQELHSPNVLVVDFNGNTTRGIDQHLQWALRFVAASPESKVSTHRIEIAAGNWTAATGILPGNLTMVTIAHWEDGRIAEEYLFLQGLPLSQMMNQTGSGQ
jgi:hypothetical protein